jgi:hypothetical protein
MATTRCDRRVAVLVAGTAEFGDREKGAELLDRLVIGLVVESARG